MQPHDSGRDAEIGYFPGSACISSSNGFKVCEGEGADGEKAKEKKSRMQEKQHKIYHYGC